MTQKEKKYGKDFAEYLVNKYLQLVVLNPKNANSHQIETAKNGAIMCVEELKHFYDSQFELKDSKTEEYLDYVLRQIETDGRADELPDPLEEREFKWEAYNEHQAVLRSGMFWEFYPSLSGVWEDDREEFMVEYKKLVEFRKKYKDEAKDL
jgi:hypothetical protein